MPKPPGKPVLGAILGAAFGAIVVAILQQGAVLLPTRLVVFGVLALSASAGSLLLTSAYRSRGVAVVQSVAALFLVFALTGITATTDAGNLEGGCTASAESYQSGVVTPADTSLRDPLTVDPTSTLRWQASTPAAFTDWSYSIWIDVAGFPIEVWSDAEADGTIGPAWGGSEDLSTRIGELEDISGLTITGVYHVWGSIRGDEGACEAELYFRIVPDNLFAGPILVGLWTAAAILLLVFGVYLVQVRRARSVMAYTDPTAEDDR